MRMPPNALDQNRDATVYGIVFYATVISILAAPLKHDLVSLVPILAAALGVLTGRAPGVVAAGVVASTLYADVAPFGIRHSILLVAAVLTSLVVAMLVRRVSFRRAVLPGAGWNQLCLPSVVYGCRVLCSVRTGPHLFGRSSHAWRQPTRRRGSVGLSKGALRLDGRIGRQRSQRAYICSDHRWGICQYASD